MAEQNAPDWKRLTELEYSAEQPSLTVTATLYDGAQEIDTGEAQIYKDAVTFFPGVKRELKTILSDPGLAITRGELKGRSIALRHNQASLDLSSKDDWHFHLKDR